MKEPHSFVIRIYRRDAGALAGLVENVATGRAAPFRTLAELCELLAGRRRFPRSRAAAARPVAPASNEGERP